MTNTSVVIDAGFAYKAVVVNPVREVFREHFGRWQTEGQTVVAPTLWLYELTWVRVPEV